MLDSVKTDNILFIDVETVPLVQSYDKLGDTYQQLWSKKSETLKRKEEDTAATLFKRAGIYAEFGKIICISAGVIYREHKENFFRVKSFYGEDEHKILSDF